MQVASDPPPLLLAKPDDALPRELELLREPDRMDGGRDLRHEVDDQAVVSLPEALARPRREPELANLDALVVSGSEKVRGGRAVLGDSPGFRLGAVARDCHPDVLQGERLAERLDDGGKHGVRLLRSRERPAEPGDRGIGIVTLAVHQPVDETLHACPQRLEADCNDTDHDEGEDEVAAVRERRADQADDGDIGPTTQTVNTP